MVTAIKPVAPRCGRKWKAEEAVGRARSRLQIEDMVRGQVGRQGSGTGVIPKPVSSLSWKELKTKVSRLTVKEHIEEQFIRSVQMGVKGVWRGECYGDSFSILVQS